MKRSKNVERRMRPRLFSKNRNNKIKTWRCFDVHESGWSKRSVVFKNRFSVLFC